MTFGEVLDQRFNAGQHMDLCTAMVINCGMGVNYVLNHGELMSFT